MKNLPATVETDPVSLDPDLAAAARLRVQDIRPLLGGRSIRTIDLWIASGKFPKPEFLVGRRREWSRGTVLTWLRQSGRSAA